MVNKNYLQLFKIIFGSLDPIENKPNRDLTFCSQEISTWVDISARECYTILLNLTIKTPYLVLEAVISVNVAK